MEVTKTESVQVTFKLSEARLLKTLLGRISLTDATDLVAGRYSQKMVEKMHEVSNQLFDLFEKAGVLDND